MTRKLILALLFLTRISYGQSLSTSSIAIDYEVVEGFDEIYSEISSLIGNKVIKSKFFRINGNDAIVELNYAGLESRLNTTTGVNGEDLKLKITKVFSSEKKFIEFEGTYGAIDVGMEIDFVTGLTTTIPHNTKYRVIISNIGNNNVLFDYTGHSDGYSPKNNLYEVYDTYRDTKDPYLNIRSGPSSNFKIVYKLKDGNEIEVLQHNLGKKSQWVKVYYSAKNITGYVHSRYIRRK